MTQKEQASKEAETPPQWIVLDTNMLMRLLIVEFATNANFFASVAKAGARIVFAPEQEDEVWRNLPKVFDEHREAWKDLLSKAKSGPPAINTALRGLEALRVDTKTTSEAARALQASSDKLKLPDHSWEAFSQFAEQALSQIARVASGGEPKEADRPEALVAAAERRVRLRNPPTNPKKDHHLVDCLLWETVLGLLRGSSRVWFASTDGDFLYDGRLHPFLDREARRAGGNFRFFPESPQRGFNPGIKFLVLQAMVPADVAAKFLPAADLVSPAELADEDESDYDDSRDPDPSKCPCGSPARIDSLTCRRCGLDSFEVSGDENYSLHKTRTGYRVTSTYCDPRGDQESGPVTCERCKATVFDVSFESTCDYCKHMWSKDD